MNQEPFKADAWAQTTEQVRHWSASFGSKFEVPRQRVCLWVPIGQLEYPLEYSGMTLLRLLCALHDVCSRQPTSDDLQQTTRGICRLYINRAV